MRAQQLLVCSILTTDVVQHDRLMQDVQCIVSERTFPLSSQCGVHNRLRVGAFLLHCADVSNAAKPFHIAERWTELIMMYVDTCSVRAIWSSAVTDCTGSATWLPQGVL